MNLFSQHWHIHQKCQNISIQESKAHGSVYQYWWHCPIRALIQVTWPNWAKPLRHFRAVAWNRHCKNCRNLEHYYEYFSNPQCLNYHILKAWVNKSRINATVKGFVTANFHQKPTSHLTWQWHIFSKQPSPTPLGIDKNSWIHHMIFITPYILLWGCLEYLKTCLQYFWEAFWRLKCICCYVRIFRRLTQYQSMQKRSQRT